LETNIGLLLGI